MKTKLFISTIFILVCSSSYGQIYSKAITDKIKLKQKSTLEIIGKEKKYAPIGVPGDIRFRTASLPISFSRLEKDSAGNWKIGSAISLGGSYIWGWGNGTLNPDSSITADPHFYCGFTGNFGIVQDKNNSSRLSPSLTLGAIIGFSSFALMFGADMLNKTPIIGIAYNISGFPLLKNLTSFNDYPTVKIGK